MMATYEGLWPSDPVWFRFEIYKHAQITAEEDPRFKNIGSIGKALASNGAEKSLEKVIMILCIFKLDKMSNKR